MTLANFDSSDYPTCAQMREMGLPVSDVLSELESALGHEDLIAFLQATGGAEFHVPSKPPAKPPSSPEERAGECLRQTIGWGSYQVPLGPTSAMARSCFAILKGLRQGQTVSQIAKSQGLNSRTVTRRKAILSELGLLDTSADTSKGQPK
ncbi:hypothetical protein [Anianabacter salinae]|uniref:hypothetical protein n=1 Tax=Anianabacter salinae TaxID=2851023 RepID=UPI00225E2509|nr:hypothetical protein [Anianabacter salinae]MBV0912852.1 hypothetical protein [Anianabacter salinae]